KADSVALARLIRGLSAKVNAIPFNEDPNLPRWMQRPDDEAIDAFADALVRNGAHVTVRRSKGREIAAACGQLRGKTERKRPQRRRLASKPQPPSIAILFTTDSSCSPRNANVRC